MALTGYEKSLNEYSKNELISIAQQYTIYYQTASGRGAIGNYQSLTKEQLISLIENDRDYQRAQPKSRVEILKTKIDDITDSEEIMIEIISLFKDLEIVPEPGKYYTFIYNAKTPKMKYDQHPLIAALQVFSWGFRGLNFHWQDVDPSQCIRNYTWNEVAGQLHVVYNNEIEFMKGINYSKFRINK
jgi:hypothetical protein